MEINDKDLEKAEGGLGLHSVGCGNFEAKKSFGWAPQQCVYCEHFKGTRGGGGVCTLDKGEQS